MIDQPIAPGSPIEEHIIPGDPLIRTRTLLAAVLVGTIGLAAVIYAQSYFNTMMELRATKPQARILVHSRPVRSGRTHVGPPHRVTLLCCPGAAAREWGARDGERAVGKSDMGTERK